MIHILIKDFCEININKIREYININSEPIFISHRTLDPEAPTKIQIKGNCFIYSSSNNVDLKNIPLYVYLKNQKFYMDYKYIILGNDYDDLNKLTENTVLSKNGAVVGYSFSKEIISELGAFKVLDDLNILYSQNKNDNYVESSIVSLDIDYLVRYIMYSEMKSILNGEKQFLCKDYGNEYLNQLRDSIKETIDTLLQSETNKKPELFYYNKKANGTFISDYFFVWLNTLYNRKMKKFTQYIILQKFMESFKYMKNASAKTKLAQESYLKSVIHVPIFEMNPDYKKIYDFVNSKV